MKKINTDSGLPAGRAGRSFHTLFTSGLCSIHDLTCYCSSRVTFRQGYTQHFCINVTRTGYFTYNAFRRSHEEYTCRILVEKPGCEFTLTQETEGTGACTVFRFTDEAYAGIVETYGHARTNFVKDPDNFSLMIGASPEATYLHDRILKAVQRNSSCGMAIDVMVAELVDAVMDRLDASPGLLPRLSTATRRHHLTTMERAKDYMLQNLSRDISLNELASYCFLSPFHFSRLFRQFNAYAPYQYLQQLRLKHAEVLIRTTDLPMTDICFRSGFTRPDYFSAAFSKKYAVPPSRYRHGIPQDS